MDGAKYRLMLDFMKKRRISYGVGFFFMFLASYSQSYVPKILGSIIDGLKRADFDQNAVLAQVGTMLLLSAAAFGSTYLWRTRVIGNARKMECWLRGILYRQFQALPSEFYSRQKTGDLIAYAINDISAVRLAFGPATAMSVNGLFVCAASIFFMATTIDFRLTLITLLPIPLVIAFMLLLGRRIQDRFRAVQKTFGEISDRVQENISGIRVIKAFVQEEKEIERFEELNQKMMASNVALVRTSAWLTPIIEICFSASFFLNLVIGGNLVLGGSISLGDFVAFNAYLGMIMAPIVSIGQVIARFHKGLVSLQRLNKILDLKPGIADAEGAADMPVAGDIRFADLTFRYPGAKHPALERIDLTIGRGKTLGVIGKTGSGKTTLANLLLRLYETEPGELLIDGVDIKRYSLESLRNGFGFVPQDVFLFSATIRENIAFFKDCYSSERIREAAEFAEIHESIVALPNGFETVLGERGVNLSGGQKQRVSIARAVVKEPAVLILDDALSAVDALTESRILNNISRRRKGKTTIIITHRVSSISGADEIIVMNKGGIAERGRHEELLAKRGLYFDIAVEQSKDAVEYEI